MTNDFLTTSETTTAGEPKDEASQKTQPGTQLLIKFNFPRKFDIGYRK